MTPSARRRKRDAANAKAVTLNEKANTRAEAIALHPPTIARLPGAMRGEDL